VKRLVPILLICALGASGPACAQAAKPVAAAPVSGPDFLARNAHAAGVVTLPSGLQYKVVQSGPAGPSPKPGDILRCIMRGPGCRARCSIRPSRGASPR
jgi:FKBP-type peptidyl-prolyl cis-trans isomerase FklB